MLRSALVAALLIAASGASAFAQDEEERDRVWARMEAEAEAFSPEITRDGFVISGDLCGASRYAHLVGRNYAEVTEASLLPTDSVLQNRNMVRTLEYTPQKLNVAVGGDGRIIAVGCF